MSEDPDEKPQDWIFVIPADKTAKILLWQRHHLCTLSKKQRRGGAIGGRFTFQFTDTSIGQIQTLACACGKEFLISDDL